MRTATFGKDYAKLCFAFKSDEMTEAMVAAMKAIGGRLKVGAAPRGPLEREAVKLLNAVMMQHATWGCYTMMWSARCVLASCSFAVTLALIAGQGTRVFRKAERG